MTRRNRLDYDRCEDRRMLATALQYGFELFLQGYQDEEVLSIRESGLVRSYRLTNGDAWNGNVGAGITGLGTDTLYVNRAANAPRTYVKGANYPDTNTLDVVFASDIIGGPFRIEAESVSQVERTSLNLENEIFARSIVLTEPSNEFDLAKMSSEYLDLRSNTPIQFDNLYAGSGKIESTGIITIGDGYHPGFTVDGNLTLESGSDIRVFADRLGVTGRLNMIAPNNIRISSHNMFVEDCLCAFNGNSELKNLNFKTQGLVDIDVTAHSDEYGIAPPIRTRLVGDNTAHQLDYNIGHAILTNAEGMTLTISSHADIRVHKVYMANHATDRISIGQRAYIDARPRVFFFFEELQYFLPSSTYFGEQGDVRFGWFRSESSAYVTLHEDDSTYLVRGGGISRPFYETMLLSVNSNENIEVYEGAVVNAKELLVLRAEGRLTAEPGQSKTLSGRTVTLQGDSISVDQLNSGTINFNSRGNVQIDAISDATLRGQNTGHVVNVETPHRIATIQGTTLDAQRLTMIGRSIWLANRAANERISVAGRATLRAPNEFVVVGQIGSVQAAHLNLQTGFAKVHFDNHLHLVGSNFASTARFFTSGNITDDLNATLHVANRTEFYTPGAVYLADGPESENQLMLCGHTVFDIGVFASVHTNGKVHMKSWDVTPGVGHWINVDSNSC